MAIKGAVATYTASAPRAMALTTSAEFLKEPDTTSETEFLILSSLSLWSTAAKASSIGIPIELALAAVDQRLRDESIRNSVSLVVSGSFRNSADVVKAIALGADAVYVATAPLIAMGCHMCQQCHTGKCNWGIATQRPELTKRLDPDEMAPRVVNLVNAWNHEIKEMLGGMGLNSIDSLRGNRLMLRGIGLNDKELEILGIRHAGE